MVPRSPILIVDMFANIVSDVDKALFPTLGTHVQFHYGSSIQILQKLVKLNEGITTKNRFPLIALFQPFDEVIGTGFQIQLNIKKLVIATLTNSTDEVPKRYQKTFVPILYPIYYELLNQIIMSKQFLTTSPGFISHTKNDDPGSPPPKGSTFNEFVDAIELYNLKLKVLT